MIDILGVKSLLPVSDEVARIRLVVYFDGFLCVHVASTLRSLVHVIYPQPGTRLHLSTCSKTQHVSVSALSSMDFRAEAELKIALDKYYLC